jgi:hypothetical protein
MLEKETIQLSEVKTGIEDEKMVVRVKVKNPTERTLYAYGSVRDFKYDNATGKLILYLNDHHHDEADNINKFHLPQPRIVQLEGKTTAEIKLKIAPVIKRVRPAAERGTGPMVEELRIAEAKEIEVEIAHQDVPFYYDPKKSNVRQFREWGDQIAKKSFKVTPLAK